MIRLLIISLLLGLSGCNTSQAPVQGHVVRSNDQAYVVRWTSKPTPIPVNEFFSLDIEVFQDGVSVRDTTMTVDAAMPQHHHGMNHRPHVVDKGSGRWHVEDMLFHMPGDWVLYFDIRHDGVIHRAQQDIEVD
jgi:hypothetical protein